MVAARSSLASFRGSLLHVPDRIWWQHSSSLEEDELSPSCYHLGRKLHKDARPTRQSALMREVSSDR